MVKGDFFLQIKEVKLKKVLTNLYGNTTELQDLTKNSDSSEINAQKNYLMTYPCLPLR